MKVVIDFETTGLSPYCDEILSVSIIDENGKVLLDKLCKPAVVRSWEAAQAIHGISPDDVKDCPHFAELVPEVKDILFSADSIIAYNADFEIGFLVANGIDVIDAGLWFEDPMLMFAPIYGEWNSFRNDYKWQKLSVCADYYGYKFKAHNSLEDVKATLYCYKKMMEN